MRAIIIVVDGFGVGAMPDANKFGDQGSNTFLNLHKIVPLRLPNLKKMGLFNIVGENFDTVGAYGKMSEKTFAKDTTAGHWEMMGIVMQNPFVTFPEGFPEKLVKKLEEKFGTKTLCNGIASGTAVINEYGAVHLQTRFPIVYTSADSVLQIACHDSVCSKEELYKLCEIAREVCKGEFEVGRIIARPFDGEIGNFQRTPHRKDYSVKPSENLLTAIVKSGLKTIAVGKISDIFAGVDIMESHPTKGNQSTISKTIELLQNEKSDGLIFVNLLDTDMIYGHRNDCEGYAKCLEEFDSRVPEILKNLRADDVLIITSDHGNDPTTSSTDHSREYVPIMIIGKNFKANENLGTINGYDYVAKIIRTHLFNKN